jgi:outer membrane biosynthesis protein TonB
MQQAIEEATQRFSDTARAMRETAREVGHELEATRAELARGVSELPEETRASAAAMRRVVAEQIEALSELNAIVRGQPATHDLTDRRGSQPRAAAAPRQPEPAPYQPPRQPEPEAYRPEPAAQTLVDPIRTAPRPAEPVRAPARPAAQVQPTPAPVQQPQPAPAARPAAPQPQRQEAEAGEGGGWLRDVLRNASASQAGQPTQGLSTLTEEIANAIDDNALADAWARYQAGESNVFSRRIYSLTGQGTYDEVRKRLQRDPDFARTAQAYMSDFEQLLKRAAAGPRPAAETREYLLSDRGKVYTTLAHASGRLS